MFRNGEKVVYPGHGVGLIEGIQARSISGVQCKFYMLRFLESEMTIMIPTENVTTVGLRPIISKDMVSKVYRILRTKKVEGDQQTWNRRYRGFMEKIRTGSLFEVGEVYRDLSLLKQTKQLSHGEKQMLRTARDLLVKELAVARASTEDDVAKELDSMFKN